MRRTQMLGWQHATTAAQTLAVANALTLALWDSKGWLWAAGVGAAGAAGVSIGGLRIARQHGALLARRELAAATADLAEADAEHGRAWADPPPAPGSTAATVAAAVTAAPAGLDRDEIAGRLATAGIPVTADELTGILARLVVSDVLVRYGDRYRRRVGGDVAAALSVPGVLDAG